MKLTQEEKRRLKQDGLTRSNLRRSISWFILLVEFALTLRYAFSPEIDLRYVLCHGALAATTALDLCMIYGGRMNPEKNAPLFHIWTLIYGAHLLAWAVGINQLEVLSGRGNMTFFTAVTAFAVTIRLAPAISMTMVGICFAVNYYLMVKINGYSTYELVGYLCFFFWRSISFIIFIPTAYPSCGEKCGQRQNPRCWPRPTEN